LSDQAHGVTENSAAQLPDISFGSLDLAPSLMRGIEGLGFEKCSPIQAQILPHTLEGHDAIGKAQTGTGKTAAFLITLFNDLLNNPIEGERYLAEPRAVVLAPTRELVMQIADDARQLGKHTGLSTVTLIGGADYAKQLAKVNDRVTDIVVATPGRLIDFIQRGDMYLDRVESLVLDEADRMLDMGFIPQVKRIVRSTPRKEDRQTLLFSATFSQDIMNLAQQWTFDPITVEIEPERVATENVEQRVYLLESRDRLNILQRILITPEATSVIVFANRRDVVRKVHERLQKQGLDCGILSGEIPQAKRTKTLERFKTGKLRVLIATDVAGRGIHVDGVSHVVNYDLPEDPEDYVHRIGRTGRAGEKGISISFASENDAFLLPEIEALLGEPLKCTQVPQDLLVD
jgi:ATP-dependent RNA helicase RhlB